MKMYGREEMKLHTFLTSAVEKKSSQLSASVWDKKLGGPKSKFVGVNENKIKPQPSNL
jgi:hypothetical protein